MTTPLDSNKAALPLSPAVKARLERIRARQVMLETQSLGKSYSTANGQIEALRNLNIRIHRREFICVVGPSGCGKSTLLRTLAGLEKPSRGTVLVDGNPISGPGQDRGVVFQGYSLFPWLTVKRNVMFGQQIAGLSRDEADRNARVWLDLVGLSQFADAYPHQLSGGMKQRVAIARALVNQPRVLLMDEPFGALDPQTRSRMQGHLLEIWRNVDITILFITHDLDEAIYLADRILVLKANPGEVLQFVDVPLPRQRSPECVHTAEFQATKAFLEELIHEPEPADEDQGIDPRVFRLTRVDDNIE